MSFTLVSLIYNTFATLLMVLFAPQKSNSPAGMELKFYFSASIFLYACAVA